MVSGEVFTASTGAGQVRNGMAAAANDTILIFYSFIIIITINHMVLRAEPHNASSALAEHTKEFFLILHMIKGSARGHEGIHLSERVDGIGSKGRRRRVFEGLEVDKGFFIQQMRFEMKLAPKRRAEKDVEDLKTRLPTSSST